MVEHPGMWDEARSLFEVGTVVGVMRILPMIWPEPAACRGKHMVRRGWGKRFDYRKVANDSNKSRQIAACES